MLICITKGRSYPRAVAGIRCRPLYLTANPKEIRRLCFAMSSGSGKDVAGDVKEGERSEILKRDPSPPLIQPPEKPLPGDCCGSGCVRCVWDVYYEEVEEYNKAVAGQDKSNRINTMASQGSGSARPGRRSIDPGWEHAENINAAKKIVRCKYCGKTIYGGISRLKQHIAGIQGDVQACSVVPATVKLEMRNLINVQKGKKRGRGEMERRFQEIMSITSELGGSDKGYDPDFHTTRRGGMHTHSLDDARRREIGGNRDTTGCTVMISRSDRDPPADEEGIDVLLSRGLRGRGLGGGRGHIQQSRIDEYLERRSQPTIRATFNKQENAVEVIGRAVTKWFLYNNIPFNAAESPYFHAMIETIQTAVGGEPVRGPTVKEISGVYLDMEMEDIEAFIEQRIQPKWDTFGCTLICDGWSSQGHYSFINFLVYSPEGTIFLDSVDVSEHRKTADFIFRLMDHYVDTIGEDRVVQVVTDNATNYKAAGKKLMEKRKKLWWTPCAAHSIDLMLEDIGSDGKINSMILRSRRITSFIYNQQWALEMMRHETHGKELLRTTTTRFATHLLALQSLYIYRTDLQRMISSQAWKEHMLLLRMRADIEAAHEVESIIHDEGFWHDVLVAISIFEPLVKIMRLVDSDDRSQIGFLYEAIERAKESIKSNLRSRTSGRTSDYKKWWKIIDSRWEKTLHMPINAAAYFLNPCFMYGTSPTVDHEVEDGLQQVLRRMVGNSISDIDSRIAIDVEIHAYKSKDGEFGNHIIQAAWKKLPPALWWKIYGVRSAPNLARIAMRVLSQTCSSSQCERNWSTFSLIHTKSINKLSMKKHKKLVYVHYNMRLRERHDKRGVENDRPIDLDDIFDEFDPLLPWIQEKEDILLDDRDCSWLCDPLVETAEHSHQHDNDNNSRSGSPSDTSIKDGGGGSGDTGRDHSSPSHSFE